ncbi:MAG: MFS transporter [Methanomicrobium sp.]|nr:MFS transporter [Methanomicrobium sp.]
MQNRTFISILKPSNFEPSKWTLMFLLLSSMLILMGGAAVAPALPLITEAFPDASEAVVSLIITLPSLAIAFSGLFIGSISDRMGRLPVFSVSLLVFTIAGMSGFFLNSLVAILVGRFILGIGIAGITISTTALISDYYTGMTRTKVLGYQGASMGMGVLILEISGGYLAGISWRLSFLIYLIGLVIFIGVLATMKEPVRESGTMSNIPMENNQTKHSHKKAHITVAKPTPVLEIFTIYITLFLSMVMFFLMPTKLPYLVTDILSTTGLAETGGIFGNSAFISGLYLGLMGFFSALVGVFYWRIAGKMHRTSILAMGYILLCAGFIILGFSYSLLTATIAVTIIGIANGFFVPSLLTWLISIAPGRIVGKVMGGYSVSLNIGQFASSLLVVPVFALVGSYCGLFLAFSILSGLLGVLYLAAYLKTRLSLISGSSPVKN